MGSRKLFLIVSVLAVILIGGLFSTALILANRPGNRPKEGDVAPDFSLNLYKDYQAGFGDTVKLSDLKGKVVIINFWASWCEPCRDEASDLENVWQKYHNHGLVVIGIDELDTEVAAIRYLQSFGISYPNGLDLQQRIGKNQYRITGQPETFIVDKMGIIRYVYLQPLNSQVLNDVIGKLISE